MINFGVGKLIAVPTNAADGSVIAKWLSDLMVGLR